MDNRAHARRIVSAVAPGLKAAGFRRHERSFRKDLPNGIVHLIGFSLLPANGLDGGSGSFEFGVYSPNMASGQHPLPEWPHPSLAHARASTRDLRPATRQPKLFWVFDPDDRDELVRSAVEEGVPWLESLSDDRSLLALYERGGLRAFGQGTAQAISIMQLYLVHGQEGRAQGVIRTRLERAVNPRYWDDLRDFALDQGWLGVVQDMGRRPTDKEYHDRWDAEHGIVRVGQLTPRALWIKLRWKWKVIAGGQRRIRP